MRILVTFVGRSPAYRTADYVFETGRTPRRTAYFAQALLDQLRAKNRMPDRVVLLGTQGSSWQHVLTAFAGDAHPDLEADLARESTAHRVDAPLLARLASVVSAAIGTAAEPVLIPVARSDEEALALLPLLHATIPRDARVVLDLTHGLRHLPILAFVAAFALETLLRAKVEGVYYGALDLTQDGLTPVFRLDGLIALMRWVEALRTFETTGRVGAFGVLIDDDASADIGTLLVEADFYEQTVQVDSAVRATKEALDLGGRITGPVASLVLPILRERLDWTAARSLSARQAGLARRALAGRDYVRAAILAYEAALSKLIEREGRNPADGRVRDEAREDFNVRFPSLAGGRVGAGHSVDRAQAAAFLDLRDLRNRLAHAKTHGMARNSKDLETRLRENLDAILNEPSAGSSARASGR